MPYIRFPWTYSSYNQKLIHFDQQLPHFLQPPAPRNHHSTVIIQHLLGIGSRTPPPLPCLQIPKSTDTQVPHIKWCSICILPIFVYRLQQGTSTHHFTWIQCSAWHVSNSSFALWNFTEFFSSDSFNPWLIESADLKPEAMEGQVYSLFAHEYFCE